MKYILGIAGALLFLRGLSVSSLYITDFNQLSNYGMGYVVGNLLLLAGGLILMIIAWRIHQKKTS